MPRHTSKKYDSKLKRSAVVVFTIALLSTFLSPIGPATATSVSKTNILPSKLEVSSSPDFGANTHFLPGRVEDLSRGLVDSNPYTLLGLSDAIFLTFGPFVSGDVNRIPDGYCLSSLEFKITADPSGAGVIVYYWNQARTSVGKLDSVVTTVDSIANKNDKVGIIFWPAQATEGNEAGWGGTTRTWRPATPSSGDVTLTHQVSRVNLSTKDFNDGNFAVSVSAINTADVVRNVSVSYEATNVGCKTPITISSVPDTKVTDGTTSPSAGKVPEVTVGSLSAGDALDPVTCSQTFNTSSVGTDKGMRVNRDCKILNDGTDVTANYEISWAAALGSITAASSGSGGGGVSGGVAISPPTVTQTTVQPAVKKAKTVVPGFSQNSTVLTKPMKKQIRAFLKANPGHTSVVCKGFTSTPVNVIDTMLARKRGQEACNYISSRNPDLKVGVLQGAHTDEPGSIIRRVRIVLD
jgi:hypothetical protein